MISDHRGPGQTGRDEILFVVGQLGRGGAERQLFSLLKHSKLNASVLCIDEGGYWAERIRGLGYEVIELERARRFELRRLRAVIRAVRSARPQLLCIWPDGINSVYARIAALRCRTPVTVVALRSHPLLFPRWYRFLTRLLNCFVTVVVANSTAATEYAASHGISAPKKSLTIPNGVDVDEIKREAREGSPGSLTTGAEFVVGTVTRFTPNKDVDTFLRMAAQVRATEPRAGFVVVGDGPLRAEAEELSRSLGLREHVTFLGERDDVPSIVSGFDVFALTSRSEGMSNSVMEAMALGVACVATDSGDTRKLVVDGETGFVAPVGDVAALAGAVGALLEDERRRKAMGERGADRMRSDFSDASMAAAWSDLFSRLASSA